MPVLRVEDEEEREDVGGQAEVALPLLRRVVHDPPRRRRRRPAGVPRMAHVQGDAAGDARPGKVLQAKDGPVLGGVADARRGRRVAPRPLRGRDLAGARPRRAHLPQRRARRLLVHGAIVSVNLFFTSFAKQARRSRKGGFTGCANVFSPIPVTAWRGRPSAGPSACRTCRLS